MNWQAVAFDWNQVRAFLATAEEGSFSAAARALATTQPTVGRQVAALEAALGVALFDRVGKSLVLSEGGARVLAQVRAMGDAAGRVSLAAASLSQEVAGVVTVTASDLLAARCLPAILRDLSREAPGISIRIDADSEIRNLLRREADIAIRHVRPDQPDLIARQAAEAEAGFFAARCYLDEAGRPQRAEDLAGHRLVSPGAAAEFIHHLGRRGIAATEAQVAAGCDSGLVMWELIRAGLGIGVMPIALAASDPEVERVLPQVEFRFPVWLVSHPDLHASPRIRIVFDRLAAAMRATFGSAAQSERRALSAAEIVPSSR